MLAPRGLTKEKQWWKKLSGRYIQDKVGVHDRKKFGRIMGGSWV
jgi:hypothetical protein